MPASDYSNQSRKTKNARSINTDFSCSIIFLLSIIFCSCSKYNVSENIPITGDLVKIEGRVIDEEGSVSGATVRLKTKEIFTLSDSGGNFLLQFVYSESPCFITAWAEGYYITGGLEWQPGDADVELFLEAYASEDNPEYQWISAYSSEGISENCENCHSTEQTSVTLPFDQWKDDAHAQSALNIHFLTMYSGTDADGNQSPSTAYLSHPEYGSVPLSPDPNLPYYGPGYKLDFPNTAGNCASCHTPMAAIDNPYGTNPTLVEGVNREGISCDFCHKILDVKLNPSTGNPNYNMPGVMSYEFRRPFDGHQFFSGPYDDVAPGEDTYSPVQKESQYCAPCHFGSFWGVKIYNSYGEWLDSPYSEELTGRTCQECHMPAGLTDHFALKEQGGSVRDPETIYSHRMLGIRDEGFMRNAVTMNANAHVKDSSIVVSVEITNDNTGHHIPTDSPLRHVILLIVAKDEQGNSLQQLNGSVLPGWCGKGDPLLGYYAGLPGKAYAKILREYWTEKEPTGSYWMQTQIVSDNRIEAFGTATSEYIFHAPKNEIVSVTVKLIFRRAFMELMDQKGWNNPDLILASETFEFYN